MLAVKMVPPFLVWKETIRCMAEAKKTIIDNYYLLQPLGKGAFGEVFLAEKIPGRKRYAVKILNSQTGKESLRGFLNEARTSRLEHPHIVRIRDFGIDGETPFIVMDYIEGGTLRQLHPHREPLPLKTVLSYVRQIGSALQYAHNEGLVHRDVKPENLLVGSDGKILLSDFGIVTTSLSWNPAAAPGIAGTAVYMAPEQIQGQPVRASDQYALAAIVYEWLVGVPPFRGNWTEIMAQHLKAEPPSIVEQNPDVPEAVEKVVLKALEKNPGMRFASVSDFVEAFEQACRPPVGTTLLELDGQADLMTSLAWSPDGTQLLLASRENALHRWDAETGQDLGCRRGALLEATAIACSPDGTLVAVAGRDRRIQIWEVEREKTLTICRGHVDEVLALAWSPDGRYLASGGSDRTIQLWLAQSGKNLTASIGHVDEVLALAWSPDGLYLASASYDTRVHVYEALTGKKLMSYRCEAGVYALAWSPDSTYLAAASYDTTVRVYNIKSGQEVQCYQQHTAGVFAVCWSPDGGLIASGDDDAQIHVWQAISGKQVYVYCGHTGGIRALAWAPATACIASGGLERKVLLWQAPDSWTT